MAHSSKTRICNLALSNVHATANLENVDTETTAEAKTCRLWYDHVREQTLSAMDWTFARKRLVLAAHSDDPPTEWAYRYQYPSDAIQMRKLENPAGATKDRVPYEIELASDGTKSIVTDLNEAIAVYTRDEETTTLFSPDFVMAFAFLLGFYIAGPMTGKRTIKEEMRAAYQQQIVIAGSINLNEEGHRAPRDAPWTDGSVR
jgi:hypothetical protein